MDERRTTVVDRKLHMPLLGQPDAIQCDECHTFTVVDGVNHIVNVPDEARIPLWAYRQGLDPHHNMCIHCWAWFLEWVIGSSFSMHRNLIENWTPFLYWYRLSRERRQDFILWSLAQNEIETLNRVPNFNVEYNAEMMSRENQGDIAVLALRRRQETSVREPLRMVTNG